MILMDNLLNRQTDHRKTTLSDKKSGAGSAIMNNYQFTTNNYRIGSYFVTPFYTPTPKSPRIQILRP